MDIKRFNERMGKMHKFSKGGHVGKRRYFDVGGPVGGPQLPPPGGASVLSGPTAITTQAPQTTPGGIFGGALGLNNTFQAAGTNLTPGTNTAQLNNAYTGVQGALGTQTGQVGTLNPQVANAVNAQNVLQGQYANQAAGLGPNVARTQLATATGQNVANTAANMAGQRGAASNVGLIARQAGQTGANIQQQAVGQNATLEAQQEIAAQQNQAALAANQIAQSQNAANAATAAQTGEQGVLQGANTALNNTTEQAIAAQNATNAATAAANQKNNSGLFQMGLSSLSSALGSVTGGAAGAGGAAGVGAGGAEGGDLLGGFSDALGTTYGGSAALGGAGVAGDAAAGTAADTGLAIGAAAEYRGGEISKGPHDSHVANFLYAEGGETGDVKALVSPGEIYLAPHEVKKVVEEGANPLKLGKKFLGKPKVKGDSLKNDTIPETLEEGGVVIPRHIMNKKDPEKAELFVRRAVHMTRPKGA